jgi:hypothetical protein
MGEQSFNNFTTNIFSFYTDKNVAHAKYTPKKGQVNKRKGKGKHS